MVEKKIFMSNTCLLFFGKGNLRLNNWNSTTLVVRTAPMESEDQDLILGGTKFYTWYNYLIIIFKSGTIYVNYEILVKFIKW